jgi:hypothetical protein
MKKLIKQIICGFIAIIVVIGLTTGSANAQLAPSVSSAFTTIGNQVIVALDDMESCKSIICDPTQEVQYFAHPSRYDAFCQCSNGVPYFQPCPSTLHFNPNLNVCDYPENAGREVEGSKDTSLNENVFDLVEPEE